MLAQHMHSAEAVEKLAQMAHKISRVLFRRQSPFSGRVLEPPILDFERLTLVKRPDVDLI